MFGLGKSIGFNELSRTNKSLVCIHILIALVWFLVDLCFVLLFQEYMIDLGVLSGKSNHYLKAISNNLFLMVLSTGLLRFILLSFRSHISSIIYQQFLRDHRQKILEESISNILSKKTYESSALFNEIIFQAGSFWQQLPVVVSNVLIGLSLTCYALFTFGKHFFTCAGIVGIVYLTTSFIIKRLDKRGEKSVVDASFRLSRFFVESLRNSFFFNIYRMNEVLFQQSRRMLDDYFHLYYRHSIYSNYKSLLPQVVGFTVVLGYLNYLLGHGIFGGEIFLAFFYVFLRLSQQAGETIGSIQVIRLNYKGWEKLRNWYSFGVRKGVPSFKDYPIATNLSENVTLDISSLNFSYDGKKKIIADLNINLRQGDILHLEGSSGAGKSTLLSLILGINPHFDGEIKYRGEKIEKLGKQYADELAYVGPESFFIEDSLRNNLLLSNDKKMFSDKEILEVLDLCSIKKEVLEKPEGLETVLTENVQFSTGQKQRISLARALLRLPHLVILDEATANIDDTNESIISDAIQKYSPSCITIVIAHKGKLINICNRKLTLSAK